MKIQNNSLSHLFSITIALVTDDWIDYKLSSAQVLRPNYPFNCFTWDISQEVIKDGVEQVMFGFKDIPGTNVEIKLKDKRLSCNRPSLDSKFYSSGPDIKLDLGNLIQYTCLNVVFIQGTKSTCIIQ